MKALIWVVGALLLLVWTGLAAVSDALLGWLVSSGDAAARLREAGDWASLGWPAVLTQWLPVEWLSVMAQGLSETLDATLALWPWLMTAASWLTPLVWVIWALGALSVLLMCGVAHWMLGRWSPAGLATRAKAAWSA